MSNYFTIPLHPPPSPYRTTYQIHTDLLHVQVRLVVNGHSSVTIIFCAKSCPGWIYLRIKWVMIFFTSLGKNIVLLQWYVNVRNLSITSDFPGCSYSKIYGKEFRYKKNLVIANISFQSLGPLLSQLGSTVTDKVEVFKHECKIYTCYKYWPNCYER